MGAIEAVSSDRAGSSGRAVSAEVPVGTVRAGGLPGRDAGRRAPARRVGVGPVPVGPGRAPVRRSRRSGAPRPSVARSCSSVGRSGARPVALRPARRRLAPVGLDPRVARRRAVALAVLVAVGAALLVAALGLLAGGVRTARVPSATGLVQVHADESLWQVARRVAPSADPGAVAARIVELNDLASPSVQPGRQLISPIG